MKDNSCPCGSDKVSYWKYDARGIPLCKCCDKCVEEKLSRYRAEVLTNANYKCDEPIDEEEGW